ncbi:hypothetical protein [Aquabacterium sp.]|nr:hypothetical protein [Aquabacterium sp.]
MTPIDVTQKGVAQGEPATAKNWKLMFDARSFEDLVPFDLR